MLQSSLACFLVLVWGTKLRLCPCQAGPKAIIFMSCFLGRKLLTYYNVYFNFSLKMLISSCDNSVILRATFVKQGYLQLCSNH